MAEESLESEKNALIEEPGQASSGWLKFGLIAAASVLAGGVAAAWWYRKTLIKLHQNGEICQNPYFGIHGGQDEEHE